MILIFIHHEYRIYEELVDGFMEYNLYKLDDWIDVVKGTRNDAKKMYNSYINKEGEQ